MKSEYLNNKVFERLICQLQQSKRNKVKYKLILDDLEDSYKIKQENNLELEDHEDFIDEVGDKLSESEYEFNESQEQLAIAFYTLSENIVRYAKFNLIDSDDAIQEGVLICFEKIDRFNPQKGKAFNYMTTCILNHFRQLYRTARNYNELKRKYQIFLESRVTEVLIKNGQKIIKG